MSSSVLTHSLEVFFPHFCLPVVPSTWGDSAFPLSFMLVSWVRGVGLHGDLESRLLNVCLMVLLVHQAFKWA